MGTQPHGLKDYRATFRSLGLYSSAPLRKYIRPQQLALLLSSTAAAGPVKKRNMSTGVGNCPSHLSLTTQEAPNRTFEGVPEGAIPVPASDIDFLLFSD